MPNARTGRTEIKKVTDGKIKVAAVVGPTASGKTALAVELAKRLGGEIISCDSMQVYEKMDIGTAKVTEAEAGGIPHHLISLVPPTGSFSCAEYAALAREKISEISERGRLPILCGGTGLYLDSTLSVGGFSEAGRDGEYREALMKKSPDELYAELLERDPESALKTHKNNVKRVIRALEIYYSTGVTKTEWDRRSREAESPYGAVIIGLDFKSRETLYERIDKRVDIMLESGLLSEVRALDCKAFREGTASEGIGYKELLAFIDGRVTLSEATEEIKKNSRNYAKRQLTWFRRNKAINWIYPDDPTGFGAPESVRDEDKFEFIVNYAMNIINNR